MKYMNVAKKRNTAQPKQKNYKKPILIAACVLGFFGLSLILFGNDVKAIFNPISIVANISEVKLNETDGRTNILVLGSDKRQGDTRSATLTDTILVASIGRVDKTVTLISLPRDLWVKTTGPTPFFIKINAVYAYEGGEGISQVVENVLGIPIHYYAVVDFELFKDTVDTLGGVEVVVDNSFVDSEYPVEGKENAPLNERYETVSFSAGKQQMDGETALKFARSRKGSNNEGTDFARAARQQKVIMAIKDKALSLNTIINPAKLSDLYNAYEKNVDTNLTFNDIQNFYLLSQQINFEDVTSIVLDDRSAADSGGLLYAPEDTSLYDGQYVLLPRNGDFSQMHAYVQRYIFGIH